jgi:hypothetical protein
MGAEATGVAAGAQALKTSSKTVITSKKRLVFMEILLFCLGFIGKLFYI